MLGMFCIGAMIGLIAGSILGKKNGYEKGYKACLEYEAEERTNLDKIEMATTKKDDTEVDAYEQKPAEWSEEDEKYLDYIIKYITHYDFNQDEMGTLEEYHKLHNGAITWLKSLRSQPHWKPSEEQMGALNHAYCELFKREDAGHNILGPLQNLIDTLSKL